MTDLSASAFISYSWDSMTHNNWVRGIADALERNTVHVTADFYDLRGGGSVTKFMESITHSRKIVVICTPAYKAKADAEEAGAGFEFRQIKAGMLDGTLDGRVIPVLREGSAAESLPRALSTLKYVDMRDTVDAEAAFDELHRAVFDRPAVDRPPSTPSSRT